MKNIATIIGLAFLALVAWKLWQKKSTRKDLVKKLTEKFGDMDLSQKTTDELQAMWESSTNGGAAQ